MTEPRPQERIALPTHNTRRRSKGTIPETVDVAIIGAGLGGLTAAAYLAKAGKSVAVFDGHYVAGGCATCFARGSRSNRYVFDVGVHYVGEGGPGGQFEQLLAPIGAEVEFTEMDPEGFDRLVFPDFTFRVPTDRGLYRDRLVELFPEERRGIDRYMTCLKQMHAFNEKLFETQVVMTPGALATLFFKAPRVAAMLATNITTKTLLDLCTKNPKLRAVLLGQNGDYALPPSEVSPLLHGGLANHYFDNGAWYPKGGGQMIADRIAESVEGNGGSIHLQTLVDKVIVEGGKAVGVEVTPRGGESQTVRARAVLSNADPQRTMMELVGPEHLPSRVTRRAKDWKLSDGIFMTCLGVQGDVADDGIENCNYWVFDHYDTEKLYTSCRADKDLLPQAAYITSASMKDRGTEGHSPEGQSTVEVMTALPADADWWDVDPATLWDGSYRKNPVYAERKQKVENALVHRLDSMFPGIGQRILFRESASPISHIRYTRASSGSGYGLAATPGQFGLNRPLTRLPLKGLFIAGASTRTGHGVLPSVQSGANTARDVIKTLR
ncbi:MAG: NAD(P)/FAD-dependent oxidoreductase [Proteobacteria bacterium]|nr:NAD(P)/FAD-dependent oxidoreductase [Pseudomonadota bacterium]